MKNSIISFFSITLFVLVTLFFSSCKKEGCKDTEAKNYDEEAEVDNQSCEYYTLLEKLSGTTWVGTEIIDIKGTISGVQVEKSDTINLRLTFNRDGSGNGIFDEITDTFSYVVNENKQVILDGKIYTVNTNKNKEQIWTRNETISTTTNNSTSTYTISLTK